MIIGLLGRKGVGKNFVANVISSVVRFERGGRDHQVAFADPMKRFCIDSLGLDEGLIYGSDKDKNTPTKYQWDQMPQFVRDKFPGKSGAMTIRHVIQVVGTELCRGIWGQNVWIDAMKKRISAFGANDVVMITDVRFPDEGAAIRSWGGKIWRVGGPSRGDLGEFDDPHASEAQIDSMEHDEMVDNGEGSTHKYLSAQVDGLLNKANA